MSTRRQLTVHSPLVLSYRGLAPDPEILSWARNGAVGGVVLFIDNCIDESALASSIQTLRATTPLELFVMIDEEGGRVRRLPESPESMRDLRMYSAYTPEQLAGAYSAVCGRLRRLGIDSLLAPVIDIGERESSWLQSRTYADTPDRVAAMAEAVIPIVQSHGIRACAKHFPGLGRVRLDPHLAPVTSTISEDEWVDWERIPFDKSIAAGVEMILVGHQVMRGFGETIPACLSEGVVQNRLRDRLGFSGLVLTDDLAMGAITREYAIEDAVMRALAAGCDLVLVCNDRDLQRRAVTAWCKSRVTI